MKHNVVSAMLLISFASCLAAADADTDKDLKAQARKSLERATAYLLKSHNGDGSWGKVKTPAISALCVHALMDSPCADTKARDAVIERTLNRIVSYRQRDGSIYKRKGIKWTGAGYPVYSTSLSLIALAAADRKGDQKIMIGAREWIKNAQINDPHGTQTGGFGYKPRSRRGDMSNLGLASDALYVTRYLDREPYTKDPEAAKKAHKVTSNMMSFITACQNLPETNKADWVSDNEDDHGGVVYSPGKSRLGSRDGRGKKSNLISSTAITYHALKAMMYAELDRSDPRVKAAMGYLLRHYELNENPGVGMQGYYYYLLTMAKTLDIWGVDTLKDQDGKAHAWRDDVVKQLVARQNKDGSWDNPNARYWESMKELCTAYAMTTMKIALGEGKE